MLIPLPPRHVYDLAGKSYYFCCAPCLEKFRADPDKYLHAPLPPKSSGLISLGAAKPAAASAPEAAHKPSSQTPAGAARSAAGGAPAYVCPMCPEVREPKPGACPSCGMALESDVPVASTRTEYTCPMHPEIVRPTPGSCPICGMALEPRTVTAAAEENPELRDMTRRFWVAVALTLPLLLVAMASMFGYRLRFDFNLDGVPLNLTWLEFVLATPVVLWAGWPFFQRFWTSLVNRSPNMFTLIGMGTGVAYAYSVIATLFPRIFPESLRGMSGYPDVYFEAAAAITTLVLLGQVMELRARSRTSAALRALLDLSPKTARLLGTDGVRKRRSSRPSQARRPPARSPRRKNSRGRRNPGRQQRNRRVDDHRRVHAGRKISKQQSHRSHRQRHRLIHYAGRPRGCGNLTCTHRPTRGPGATQPRSHPAARGSCREMVCSHRGCHRNYHFLCMALPWPANQVSPMLL